MSHSSHIQFYRTDATPDPTQSIMAVIKLMQPTGHIKIRSSSQPDRSWEMFQAEIRGDNPDEIFPEDDEISINGVNPSIVHTFYKQDGLLSMDFNSKLGHLKDAVVSGIPENVPGNFGPINLAVTVGFHDL